ncbi:MAG: type I-F CRISPR-associated protein Csy2 [Pseudomonadota bacterium]
MSWDGMIMIRRLHLEGANAIAGLTWGFPAITNFLGFTHALQRKLAGEFGVEFLKCAVICHWHQALTNDNNYYQTFNITRNPLDKSGNTASINEEGKMHCEVSLVIAYREGDDIELDDENYDALEHRILELTKASKVAGGRVERVKSVKILAKPYVEENTPKLLRSLLPGFALVSRHPLLEEAQQKYRDKHSNQSNHDLSAWLQFAQIRHQSTQENTDGEDDTSPKIIWERIQETEGWIKPIAVGYQAISPLYEPGEMALLRDMAVSSRHVEWLYSLGEWISPHRVNGFDEIFWQYDYRNDSQYLCVNDYESIL